jgi:hypothetical protein
MRAQNFWQYLSEEQARKSRKQRGIRTFPPPLRRLLVIYETGHFICYEKRTFSLANDTADTAELPTIHPERSELNVPHGDRFVHVRMWQSTFEAYMELMFSYLPGPSRTHWLRWI